MTVSVHPVSGIGAVRPGDDLATMLFDAIRTAALGPEPGDVLVVTHKVVSKAEGRIAPAPDDAAYRALVETEAAAVLRRRGDLVIARTQHGFICANAGVDRSNTGGAGAVLLPLDPDASAHRLRLRIEHATGVSIGVISTDTLGRAWRRGLAAVAIGISGVPAILELRGTPDADGRTMHATEVAVAD